MADYTGAAAYPNESKSDLAPLRDSVKIYPESQGIPRGGTEPPYNATARGLEKCHDWRKES